MRLILKGSLKIRLF